MDNKENTDEIFNRFAGQWDTEEPGQGHGQRFLAKLEGKKRKKKAVYKLFYASAAVLAILLGIFITYNPQPEKSGSAQLAKISPKAKEAEVYFASIIQKELAKVEKENSPETKAIVQDALKRMEQLEKDYDKLTLELIENGENKKIIHAMITNLQTRIAFLEEVLTQIENIKNIKEKYNENNNI
jgi:DNA-directed RNA polymerase beta' subunit